MVGVGVCYLLCSKLPPGDLRTRRGTMLAPVLDQLIPVLIAAAQFPDDFTEWEKDRQEDFRRGFRYPGTLTLPSTHPCAGICFPLLAL